MRRGDFCNSSRASVLHRTQPIQEADRDEEHHKGVVVSERPRGVGDVSGHEGDEPCCDDACTLSKVIFGDDGDGEHGQCTVDSGQSEHAPPNSIFRRVEEGLQEHRTDGHGP